MSRNILTLEHQLYLLVLKVAVYIEVKIPTTFASETSLKWGYVSKWFIK